MVICRKWNITNTFIHMNTSWFDWFKPPEISFHCVFKIWEKLVGSWPPENSSDFSESFRTGKWSMLRSTTRRHLWAIKCFQIGFYNANDPPSTPDETSSSHKSSVWSLVMKERKRFLCKSMINKWIHVGYSCASEVTMIDHNSLVSSMMSYSEQQFIHSLRKEPDKRSIQVKR